MKLPLYLTLILLTACPTLLRALPEPPQKTTVCNLLKDRPQWNRKLVQVTGFATHGFEDSTFYDPQCNAPYGGLWMAYGGTDSTGTMSTVSNYDRTRPEPIKVEGLEMSLLRDALFHHFDDLLHAPDRNGTTVHATVIARFFAGSHKDGQFGGGYGHLGCCSLFVIQRVLSVDDNQDPALDTSDAPDQPHANQFRGLLRTNDGMTKAIATQRVTEQPGQNTLATPEAIALNFLTTIQAKPDPITLSIIQQTPCRIIYETPHETSGSYYRVVLSRPYWLSFYAHDPHKVAWIVLGAYEVTKPA